MTPLPVTSIIAALLALFMLPLTLQVSLRRAALGRAAGDFAAVTFGDGGDETLRRRIRAFGNFIEYTPMCLIMLALMELAGAAPGPVWSMGLALLAGRVLHAAGMLFFTNPALRGAGMLLTYLVLLVPALWLLGLFWG